MTNPPSEPITQRRIHMPDGDCWTAWFQHEMAQLARRGRERERKLYVFFRNGRGAIRRAEVTDALKETATDDDLRRIWSVAERLDPGGDIGPDAY